MSIVELAKAAKKKRLTPEQIDKYRNRLRVFTAECERKHIERTPGPEWYRRTYTI